MQKQLTVIITHEEDGYMSLCPEFDIASQGESIEEARDNLREALELFFETASGEEIKSRQHREVYVTHMEVAVGSTTRSSTALIKQKLSNNFSRHLNHAMY